MKLFKSLALGAAALSSIGAASAQTYIYLTASNGDRTATQTAISKLLAPGWKFQGVNGNTSSDGALTTATNANFGAWNGTFAGSPVVIKVSYSGALAGIAAIAGDTDQRFVATDGLGTGTVPSPIAGNTAPADYVVRKADLGLSTNFQTTSPFLGLYENVNYNPISETIVGVSALGFYASPGFPATNITTQQAQLLFTTGAVPLSLFTGNFTNGDQNKIVYAIGRNTDAGQRFGTYAEVGLGTSTNVRVWQPDYSAAVNGTPQTTTSGITYGGVVGRHALWPAETVSGIFSPLGSGGYSSGALLAQQLTSVLGPDAYKGRYEDPENPGVPLYLYPNATAGYYIGYATPGDGNPRVLGVSATGTDLGVIPAQNRGVALTYNGVALHNPNGSVNEDNIRNGRYTAWLYNRTLKRQGPTPFTGTQAERDLKSNFFDQLTNQIKTVDAVQGGGLLDNANFRVQRFTDGGLVVPKP